MDLQWYYPFSTLEYVLLLLFLLAYSLYLRRVVYLAELLENRRRWFLLKLPLRLVYFTSLLIALLGPSFGYGKKYVEAIGKDIYLVVDLSRSMQARDVAPSRLERLKYELKNLIHTLDSDRIGLIIFSSEAFLQCPLTYDRSALDLFLQTLETHLLPVQGTDFAAALRLALERLQTTEADFNDYKSRMVILVSDGEDYSEDLGSVLAAYESQAIRIFTLGIGSIQGAQIPLTGNSFQRDESGKIVISRLDYQKLEYIARESEGVFFEISPQKNEMPSLIKTIQEIKGKRLDMRTIDVSYNKYEYFVWLALALLALDCIFTVKVLKI